MIRRFGGSTNPENQWPEEDMNTNGGDEEDRFERMEALIQRAMKRITTTGKQGGGGGGGKQSSSGMGSGMQSGSGGMGSNSAGSNDDDAGED